MTKFAGSGSEHAEDLPLVATRRPALAIPEAALYLIYALAGCALLFPAIWFRYPLGADYLNHLSRLHIIYDGGRDPLFAKFFEIHLAIIPNLGLDAGAMLAQKLGIGEEAYLKAFYLGSAAFMWAGIAACYRAVHGRLGPSLLLILPIQYAFVMAYAFMDFILGMGLCFFAVAWVVRSNPSPARTIPVVNIVAIAAFFSHFGAFLILGLYVFFYRLGWMPIAPLGKRTFVVLARSTAENAAAAALYLLAYHPEISSFSWDSVAHHLLSPVQLFDVGALPLATGITLIFGIFLGARVIDRDVSVDKRWLWLLAGFLSIAIVSPFEYHGSYFISTRIIWVDAVLFLIVAEVEVAKRRWIEIVTVLLPIGIVAGDAYWLFNATNIFNTNVAAFRAVEQAIPDHSLVFATENAATGPCFGSGLEARFLFLPALVTLDRASVQPFIFANKGMEAASFRGELNNYFGKKPHTPIEPWVAVALAEDSSGLARRLPIEARDAFFEKAQQSLAEAEHAEVKLDIAPYMRDWPSRFSYLIQISGAGDCGAGPLPTLFERVAAGKFFTVWKLK
jgi:hypothetical protein